jgi:uncharacterized ion transporter superfamily protein YfcC
MDTKAGVQISARAFIQSVVILSLMMLAAGVITRLLPAGQFNRLLEGDREVIDPATFQLIQRPDYPVWRWLTAPLEVLVGPDGTTIIVIIVFILLVGVSFAVLDGSGILRTALGRIVARYGERKYTLLLVVSLFFMCLGAFFGIFEEVVPLVPLIVALSYTLGWDALVGLGMSILATNLGFSAAITNPFTIGVAQKLAGLPLFSGAWLRIPIFIAIYVVFSIFLVRYARKVERDPKTSLVYDEEQSTRRKYQTPGVDLVSGNTHHLRISGIWLAVFLILILAVLVTSPIIPGLADFSLPLVGLLFFLGGVGAGLFSGLPRREVLRSMSQGASGIAPAIPLILMAASVKHIIAQGGILDTILHAGSTVFASASPFMAATIIYVVALAIEFLVASGSAKAFLLMPILLPLADLVGVTRQVAVTAYCFGDGFSNLAYPTNPVLLISLGLTVVSYPKWIRWTAGLWAWVLALTLVFLGIAVAIHYGPF